MMALNLSNRRLLGRFEGWRVVYIITAVLGLLSAAVTALTLSEPRHIGHGVRKAAGPGGAAAGAAGGADAAAGAAAGAGRRRPGCSCGEAAVVARDFGRRVWAVLRTPSFLVILVEHISSLTRASGGFQILYLQARPAAAARDA